MPPEMTPETNIPFIFWAFTRFANRSILDGITFELMREKKGRIHKQATSLSRFALTRKLADPQRTKVGNSYHSFYYSGFWRKVVKSLSCY